MREYFHLGGSVSGSLFFLMYQDTPCDLPRRMIQWSGNEPTLGAMALLSFSEALYIPSR